MAAETKTDKVTLEELIVNTLATTDALAEVNDRQGLIIPKSLKHSTAKRGAGD